MHSNNLKASLEAVGFALQSIALGVNGGFAVMSESAGADKTKGGLNV